MLLRELTYLAVLLRMLSAIIMGGLIGMERGMNRHSAGLRTYMLVCMGSCLIMMTNQYVCQVMGSGDPIRMGAQVVSGIGFLGAGTIMVTRRNQIKGLTTAAGLWAAAGVGLAVGIGFYEAALAGTLGIVTILTFLHRWDDRMQQYGKVMSVYVELSKNAKLSHFLRDLRAMNIAFSDIEMEQSGTEEEVRSMVMTLKTKKRKDHKKLLSQIRNMDGIVYLEEL